MRRILYLVYGAVAYLGFLGVLLYMMGFITGLIVPASLDGPESNPVMPALFIDFALILLFGLQHSIMARPTFKKAWTRIVPQPIERATYVLMSNLVLVAIFWLWKPIDVTLWNVESPTLRWALHGLCLAGFAIVGIVTFLISHFDLFGLRQVWLNLRRKAYASVGFVTPGPYKLVRHPLYVGWMIAFWATPTMTLGHLLFAAALTTYMVIAVFFEERNLVEEHGAKYERYRQSTPKYFPRLRPATVTASAQPAADEAQAVAE